MLQRSAAKSVLRRVCGASWLYLLETLGRCLSGPKSVGGDLPSPALLGTTGSLGEESSGFCALRKTPGCHVGNDVC